jgi:hypothetical protein
MSKPDSAPSPAAHIDSTQIDAATADLDRRLRRLRISRRDRRVIVDGIRGDLHAAAADGVSPAALIGPDVDAFAREAVEAGGYRARSRDYPRVLTGGVLAAAAAVVVGYLLIVEVLTPVLSSWFTLDGSYPTVGPLVAYGGVVLVGLLGVLVAVRSLLAGRPAARETLNRAALLLPIGAAAGIAAVIAVARDPDYRVTVAAVTVQVLFVVLGVAAALASARWWSLRTVADEEQASTSHHA